MMPAASVKDKSTELPAFTATGEITCTRRSPAETTGVTVQATLLTLTEDLDREAGTVVPEGNCTVMVSPTANAPLDPVTNPMVYAASVLVVLGLGVTVAEVSEVVDTMIYGADVIRSGSLRVLAFTV